MKIASYNLNGIRARLPRLIEWLEREQPDIACLQELKCADEALPIADIEAAGYGAVWHGQKGFNGVAILAKGNAPELRRIGLPGDPDDTHSRYIEAEAKDVIVASLYLPNGNPVGTEKFDYKIRWMERLLDRTTELYKGSAAGRALRRLERGTGGPRRFLGAGNGQRRGHAARGAAIVAANREPRLD